jgi:hypothetical protein
MDNVGQMVEQHGICPKRKQPLHLNTRSNLTQTHGKERSEITEKVVLMSLFPVLQ